MNSGNSKIDLNLLLGERTAQLLAKIGSVAADEGMRAYLVGGVVRDLLLGTASPDIDVMVEGDATAFVSRLHERWGSLFPSSPLPGRPVRFPKYKTAKLFFGDEISPGIRALDFSSARGERYPSSGAAPQIHLADIATDLRRRDFTINALAVELAAESFGALFDLYGGAADLASKQLNVLHSQSFEDDPARLLRGLRFAERFGFSFGAETEKLFRSAVLGRYLERVTPQRRFDELRKALSEREPGAVVQRLKAHGLLEQVAGLDIFTALRDPKTKLEFPKPQIDVPRWQYALVMLTREASDTALREWLRDARVTPQIEQSLFELRKVIAQVSDAS